MSGTYRVALMYVRDGAMPSAISNNTIDDICWQTPVEKKFVKRCNRKRDRAESVKIKSEAIQAWENGDYILYPEDTFDDFEEDVYSGYYDDYDLILQEEDRAYKNFMYDDDYNDATWDYDDY